MKNLVIVESPGKVKTIEKFLGPDYKVMSSCGHIRDLRKKDFSIDIEDNYSPVYEIPADKRELVKQLKEAAKQAETVWLASDEDREGEAIAWHLYEVLGLKPENTRRIVFHEISKPALLHAIANPRSIDIDRVNAQQARRVLDRIVGFELSPVLWKKIKPALSAGRVQSVAVRLICEREKEIRAFVPESFMRVNAQFSTADGDQLKAELERRLSTEEEARKFLEHCAGARFSVSDISVKPVTRSPLPPFSTSTLQQEASRRLGFSVNQTMMVAQKLYEAGKITYMRTDSLNLAQLALKDIAGVIRSDMGEEYLHQRHYQTHSKGAQEAHEAIRPTYIANRTIDGTPQEKRLYELIWKRTVASQMADARLERTNVTIAVEGSAEKFACTGEVVKFQGFMSLYQSDAHDDTLLPPLTVGEILEADSITATQRFTQAPARYNEGSLVKKLEELGIGRPSTYAPTISTIQTKEYVGKGEKEGTARDYRVLTLKPDGAISEQILTENVGSEKGRLVPTDIGMVVNDFLTQYFPEILDYGFTASMEEKFDDIASGSLGWKDEIGEFYTSFHPDIERINALHLEHRVGERVLGTDPKTGKPLSVKIGRFGPVAQLGSSESEEKPLFASLMKGQSIETITFEEGMKLFELPRVIGKFEDKDVVAAIGRFGPYLRHGSLSVSLPKDESPLTITLDKAEELIVAKREAVANRVIAEFGEMPGLQVLNGRFGPYVAYKKEGEKKATNYRIAKGTDPRSLTLDDIRKLMAEQDANPPKTRGRYSRTAKKK